MNGIRSQSRRRGWALALALVLIAAVLAACGGDDGSSGGTGSNASVSTEIPDSGCGAVAVPLPDDPDGVLGDLPDASQQQYTGYQLPVRKTPWSDFKPDHGPPYEVGMAFANLTTASQAGMYNAVKKAFEADPDMKLTAVSTGNELNIPLQQQQFSQLINRKPDLLIVEPLTDAFGRLVDQAAAEGIPTISIQASTESDNVINMQGNSYRNGALASSVTFRQMGGKGNVVYVHGIASTTVDRDVFGAYNAAMKNCPDIKEAGQIAGAFLPSTAKAEMLKFLATHPQRIDGVMQTGGMAPGIIGAFEQAGRPVPIVADIGAQKGSMGYWINTPDYNGYGAGFPPVSYGNAIYDVARRMLDGQGIKVSEITNYYPPITEENLDQWADPAWTLQTNGIAEGPPQQFFPNRFIETLFANPSDR